jgi:two-component system LytT family sensor kinase
MSFRVSRRLGMYWILQLAGWGTYAIIAAATLMPMFPVSVLPRLLLTKGVRGALGLPCSDLLRRLYIILRQRSAPRWVWVFSVGAAHLALGVVWYLLFFLITRAWQGGGAAPPPFRWVEVPHHAIDSVLVLATWSALYFGIIHWRRAQGARLAALQYQLSPHFLFNALNSIRNSILEDPTTARGALTRLSDLLRQTVYAAPAAWRTLDTELEWVRNYLALEHLRFGDRIETCLAVDDGAAECLVPSFLLHPLVENAVKYGGRTSPVCLRVRISAHRHGPILEIGVANTGRLPIADDAAQHGVGLANLRERLALLDSRRNRLTLAQDGEWVRLTVVVAQP